MGAKRHDQLVEGEPTSGGALTGPFDGKHADLEIDGYESDLEITIAVVPDPGDDGIDLGACTNPDRAVHGVIGGHVSNPPRFWNEESRPWGQARTWQAMFAPAFAIQRVVSRRRVRQ